ncbi:hypothetical protein [uncultured Roseobacter sp.]|uniref:hypothetical protein n=1 Tax=uncultured Roseobacter sp. TaxID=114847 RepID=UPI00260696E1|nr:hypothetical protein [uncultured Roseobacter sp.]
MKIRIADAEFDFGRATVRRAGQTSLLSADAASVLKCLYDAEGAPVSEEALEAQLQVGKDAPGQRLTDAVAAIRAVLGTVAGRAQVISHVPRAGYRLCVPARALPVRSLQRAQSDCVLVGVFRLIRGRAEDEHAGSALTDDILSHLSRFTDFRVLSRMTSDAALSQGCDHADLLRLFGAGSLIEGSLLRHAEAFRVSVRIVSTTRGDILHRTQLDCPATVAGLSNAAAEIARFCARGLQTEHAAQNEQPEHLPVSDTGAETYEAYCWRAAAEAAYRDRDAAQRKRLIDGFSSVAAGTPDALTLASCAFLHLADHRDCVDPALKAVSLEKADAAARTSVAQNPHCARGQAALAVSSILTGDNAGFLTAANEAIRLSPRDPVVLAETGYGFALAACEAEAVALLETAIELSPVHPAWYHYPQAWRYMRLGYAEQALEEMLRVPAPGDAWYHAQLVWISAACGRTDAAQTELVALQELVPDVAQALASHLEPMRGNPALVRMICEGWRRAGVSLDWLPNAETPLPSGCAG